MLLPTGLVLLLLIVAVVSLVHHIKRRAEGTRRVAEARSVRMHMARRWMGAGRRAGA